MDSQPISNIKISIDKKNEIIHYIPFLQNSQIHLNNHILNAGLSSGPCFIYINFRLKKIAHDKHLNFHNLFTKLIHL